MAKKFSELRAAMSPEARAQAAVLAETLDRASGTVLLGDQRRTRERDAGGAGEGFEHVVRQPHLLGR